MKKKDRIAAIAAISLADLLIENGGDINFVKKQSQFLKLKQSLKLVLFKHSRIQMEISIVGFDLACKIADEMKDAGTDYIPTYCAFNILFDQKEKIDKLPKGMKLDYGIIDDLTAMIAESSEVSRELLASCNLMDQVITEKINQFIVGG